GRCDQTTSSRKPSRRASPREPWIGLSGTSGSSRARPPRSSTANGSGSCPRRASHARDAPPSRERVGNVRLCQGYDTLLLLAFCEDCHIANLSQLAPLARGWQSSPMLGRAHHDEMATPSKPAQKTARTVEGPGAGAAGNQARVPGERRRGADFERDL